MFVLLLILWPVAELFVAIRIADAVGVLLTIVLLAAGWPVGLALMRAEGRVALRRLGATITPAVRRARGADGALVVAGGALLIIPGFITDVIGLLLLLPPSRALARRAVMRNLHSRIVVRAGRMAGRGRGSDVDSTATDLDTAHLPR